jgi:hypothetical protein
LPVEPNQAIDRLSIMCGDRPRDPKQIDVPEPGCRPKP